MSVQAMAAVFKLDLPPTLKWLLVAMADNADPYGGSIFPSVATLAQKTGMTDRTIQRHLGALRTRGLVAVQAPADPARSRPTEYRFTFVNRPGPMAPSPDVSKCPRPLRLEVIAAFGRTCSYCGGQGDAERGPDGQLWNVDRIVPGSRGGGYSPENVTLSCGTCNRRKKGAILAPFEVPASLADRVPTTADGGANGDGVGVPRVAPEPSTEPSEEPSTTLAFVTFWSLYPLKVEKAGARRKFEKLARDGVDVVAIVEGARRYRDDPNRDPEFTKHPTTWLNNGCWDDDPLPRRASNGHRVGVVQLRPERMRAGR